MPRTEFEQQLRDLQDEVLLMGSMVRRAIERSMQALKARDMELAQKVIEEDARINEKRFVIEEKCVHFIVRQQPVAGDLRLIICILSLITDLERMADHAEGIAKIVLMLGSEPPLKPLIDLPRMAEKAGGMLTRSLSAFIKRDEKAAREICAEDDEVDALYDQVFRELLTFMLEDPRTITRATRLLWVGHNLERIADRVTNICERVVFLVTGKMEEIGASKY